jgi:hypothetical protein
MVKDYEKEIINCFISTVVCLRVYDWFQQVLMRVDIQMILVNYRTDIHEPLKTGQTYV